MVHTALLRRKIKNSQFKYHLFDVSLTYTISSPKRIFSLSFHSANVLDTYCKGAAVLGVGVLMVIKRLLIPNYLEFAVSRDC